MVCVACRRTLSAAAIRRRLIDMDDVSVAPPVPRAVVHLRRGLDDVGDAEKELALCRHHGESVVVVDLCALCVGHSARHMRRCVVARRVSREK